MERDRVDGEIVHDAFLGGRSIIASRNPQQSEVAADHLVEGRGGIRIPPDHVAPDRKLREGSRENLDHGVAAKNAVERDREVYAREGDLRHDDPAVEVV